MEASEYSHRSRLGRRNRWRTYLLLRLVALVCLGPMVTCSRTWGSFALHTDTKKSGLDVNSPPSARLDGGHCFPFCQTNKINLVALKEMERKRGLGGTSFQDACAREGAGISFNNADRQIDHAKRRAGGESVIRLEMSKDGAIFFSFRSHHHHHHHHNTNTASMYIADDYLLATRSKAKARHRSSIYRWQDENKHNSLSFTSGQKNTHAHSSRQQHQRRRSRIFFLLFLLIADRHPRPRMSSDLAAFLPSFLPRSSSSRCADLRSIDGSSGRNGSQTTTYHRGRSDPIRSGARRRRIRTRRTPAAA